MASSSSSSTSISPIQTYYTVTPPTRKLISKRNGNIIISFPVNPRNIAVRCSWTVAVAAEEEEMGRIRRLQNGSDVRGVAVEGEKGRAVDLTPAAVEAIAESFGEWVAGGTKARVSLGKDPRVSGPTLSAAVFAGLGRAGCEGFEMGLATTPACFMSTLLPPFHFDASIMVRTLSEN